MVEAGRVFVGEKGAKTGRKRDLLLVRALVGAAMIDGGHVVIYSKDAEADRAFLRDVLKFSFVDAHGGWLIFKLPPS